MIFNKPVFSVINAACSVLGASQALVIGLVSVVVLPCLGFVVYSTCFLLFHPACFTRGLRSRRHKAWAARSPALAASAPCDAAQLGGFEDDDLMEGVDRLEDLEEALKGLEGEGDFVKGGMSEKRQVKSDGSDWMTPKSDLKERLRRLEETM